MKILVGLSGGVDSAVAAYLLKQQGHDVTCAFMRNWDSLTNDDIEGNPTLNDSVCSQEKDWADAEAVAKTLGLPLLRIDFIQEYWTDVFEEFLSEYRKGRTPNPDILCNRYIKFDSFYNFARSKGFEMLATGHYAKMGRVGDAAVLMKAEDRNKDQSYFLAEIRKETLEHILFPLGEVDKPQVRKIAEQLELSIAKKKDSTGICFIGERRFREFLSNYLPMRPGNIILVQTQEVVGQHKGVLYYTVGQRKGLDIGGTGPYYVVGKSVERNELYVCAEGDKDLLKSDSCLVTGFNMLYEHEFPMDCTAKFRYRQPDQNVHVERLNESTLLVSYPQGISAVTPGQECVLYYSDITVGGGKIEKVFRSGEDLMEKINNMAMCKETQRLDS